LQLFIETAILASVEVAPAGVPSTDSSPAPRGNPEQGETNSMDFDPRKTLKDAAYITVGVGVTAFQQGQVRRREVQKKLTEQAKDTKAFLGTRAQDSRVKLEGLAQDVREKAGAARVDVTGRVEPLVGDLRQRVEPIVEQLQTVPAQVKQAVEAGASRAKELVNRAA